MSEEMRERANGREREGVGEAGGEGGGRIKCKRVK